MITMKKIAEMAGVSSATVSKVLNGKDKSISDETKRRVLDIVKREGYIPNGIAKSLRVKNTKTLGIIMPDVTNVFFSELAKGVETAATLEGYSVILCNSDNNDDKELRYLQVLQEKMVDGIILTASTTGEGMDLDSISIPIVLVDRDLNTNKKVGRVTLDNEKGGYMAAEHLLNKGCKSLAHITADTKNKPANERLQGFLRKLKEEDIELKDELCYFGSYNLNTGYDGINEIIKSGEFDGVFCGNDLIAIGANRCLRENGIRVPEDVRLMGFDNVFISEYMDPPLSTIAQPIRLLGEVAVEVLISLIENEACEIKRVLEPKLVERETT